MGLSNDVDDAIGLCAMLGDEEADSLRWGRRLNLEVIHGGRAICEYVRFHFRQDLVLLPRAVALGARTLVLPAKLASYFVHALSQPPRTSNDLQRFIQVGDSRLSTHHRYLPALLRAKVARTVAPAFCRQLQKKSLRSAFVMAFCLPAMFRRVKPEAGSSRSGAPLSIPSRLGLSRC